MKGALSKLGPGSLATLGIFAVTLFSYRVVHANATVAAVALLLGVLLTAVYRKLPEAVIGSVAATLCLDYFFIPPIGSITIGDPQGWIVLSVFLAVALIAANLSTRLRLQRDELISQRAEAEKLHALSRAMLFSEGAGGVERLVINKCMELFSFNEVVLFELMNGAIYRAEVASSISDETMRRVARNGSIYQSGPDKLTVAPVALGNKIFGSLGLRGPMLAEQTLHALGRTIAMGIAQSQTRDAASRAEAVRRSEELKSLMIDALAHDLKTPLTAIEAASDMLLAPAKVSAAQRQDLLEVIQQEASGLRRIVGEAIHLAHIDAERLKLVRRAVSVDELVQSAIASLEEHGAPYLKESHRIETHTAGVPLVSADKELIVQALKQLLDNAMKYGPRNSTVSICAVAAENTVTISVRDYGQGLTELEQGRVFDKFYRGRQDRSAVQGTGMGLAIVKQILQAHGGSAGVRSQPGQGSEFYIALNAAVEEAAVGPQQS